jgi:hypothetical protein
MTSLILATLIQHKPSGLMYGNTLDSAMKSYNLPLSQIYANAEDLYSKLKGLKHPKGEDIISLCVATIAPSWYHCAKFDLVNHKASIDWARKHLSDLRPGAEKLALSLLFQPDFSKSIYDFDESSVGMSGVVGSAAVTLFETKCKSEKDLGILKLAKDSNERLPMHQRHRYGLEVSYQFACYSVRKDLKALRSCVTNQYKAASVDPRPGAMDRAKKWCKMWEDYLAKMGQ